MGFNSVYRTLQIIFPQVDARLLRAVAIENPEDANTAVEAVLMDVIPYLSKAVEDASTNPAKYTPHVDSPYMDDTIKILNGSAYSKEGSDRGHEESASLEKHGKSTVKDVPDVISLVEPIPTVYANGADDYRNHGSGNTDATTGNQADDLEDFTGVRPRGCNTIIPVESHQEQSPLDVSHLEVETAVVQLAPSPIEEYIPDAPEGGLQLALVDPLNGDSEKPGSSGASDDTLKNDVSSSSQMVDFDESALNTVVTQSGQIYRINELEDIIEDAKKDKKTLFLAMESLISLMREMELKEKAALQAKEEAASGGFDILFRVEDFRQMLQHAKEANSMHAGEVYGEKAILATEARELHSRILGMSDERDKSLAILDEMRQAIEHRLNAAEKDRETAEKEKMDKEESARNALFEQQLIMEKVVEESKILKQEAEENSKLQEFLTDRGRVVDILQGEMSVICQDVKHLKEQFDERIPLSKSLSSSQTCILASSSSSLKSTLSPDLVPESSDNPKQEVDDGKVLSDDGWEFFDNREFDM